MNENRTKGIVLSYCITVVTFVSNIILVPIYLNAFGADLYGLYQYIYSIAQYAVILDFGIATVMTKFIGEFSFRKDEKAKENIASYGLIIVCGALLIITIITVIMHQNMNDFLLDGRSLEQQNMGAVLLIFMSVQLAVAIVQNYFDGVLLAYEDYFAVKLYAFIRVMVKIIIILALLYLNVGLLALVVGDLISTVICLGVSIYRTFRKHRFKIKFHYWDKNLFKEASVLSYALLLQSLVTFANNYSDKLIMGKLIGNTAVTLYSLAMTFNGMFCEIPTVIQRMYLPESIKMVEKKSSGEELTKYVSKVGRIQYLFCMAILMGFVIFGREFIFLWSGEDTIKSWSIGIILMLSSIIPIAQNMCLTILTAMNKRAFRSYLLLVGVVFNIVISVYMVKKIGLMGAPLGTLVTSLLFNCFGMNVYYEKKIKLQVKKMFLLIFPRITIVAAVSIIPGVLLNIIFEGYAWMSLIVKCIVYILVFCALEYSFGMNSDERKFLKIYTKKLVRK